ncbi:hypothetical protein FOA52_009948 [Chlamydomonas sp. UWO 241]|nr:hypothetical protein FOA52_009948 [Chlamydomonas sp. UWO 241]
MCSVKAGTIMNDWVNSLLGIADAAGGRDGGGGLQSSGVIEKATLLAFFERGKIEFESHDFKQRTRLAHQTGSDVQSVVDKSQAALLESLGVKGDYGLSFMAKVRKVYANDAKLLRGFYEFVHLEEKALDEAELPEDVYNEKYARVAKMTGFIKEREAELAHMSPEERTKVMAQLYQRMVESSARDSLKPCCAKGSCSSGSYGAAGASAAPPVLPGDAPAVEEMEDMRGGRGGGAAAGGVEPMGTQAMSADDQMRFFQSLSKA